MIYQDAGAAPCTSDPFGTVIIAGYGADAILLEQCGIFLGDFDRIKPLVRSRTAHHVDDEVWIVLVRNGQRVAVIAGAATRITEGAIIAGRAPGSSSGRPGSTAPSTKASSKKLARSPGLI